jgi:ribose 5-phosphate isomerase A
VNDLLKEKGAEAALGEVQDGMVLGLGTGSTMNYFIRALGTRVRKGLRVSTVATSVHSATLAAQEGIEVLTFREHKTLDLAVDGADEVSPGLDLVKGLGGALVREKIVASASERFVVVIDESKLVDRLGTRVPIPVEVLPFALDLVEYTLAHRGGEPRLRMADGVAFESDNGNRILDWHVGPISDPAALEVQLKSIVGVVDSGIFANLADRVIVAGSDGVRTLDRPAGEKGGRA